MVLCVFRVVLAGAQTVIQVAKAARRAKCVAREPTADFLTQAVYSASVILSQS